LGSGPTRGKRSLVRWREILDFWFGEALAAHCPVGEDLWFQKSERTDELIRRRFGADLESARAGEYEEWVAFTQGRLALILLFDQFSRNIYRGRPEAFANDSAALELCLTGVEKRMDLVLAPLERVFFYLPMEHAENLAIQRRSVEVVGRLLVSAPPELSQRMQSFYDYAVKHCEVIERFGRFPHRNSILGRENTPEEAAFLARPGSSF
jgi:uncharacterized protein (DUF924 family)